MAEAYYAPTFIIEVPLCCGEYSNAIPPPITIPQDFDDFPIDENLVNYNIATTTETPFVYEDFLQDESCIAKYVYPVICPKEAHMRYLESMNDDLFTFYNHDDPYELNTLTEPIDLNEVFEFSDPFTPLDLFEFSDPCDL